jgi:hypothetical protein
VEPTDVHLLVDDQQLVVHHRRLVFVDLDAGQQQRTPFALDASRTVSESMCLPGTIMRTVTPR